MRSLPFHPLLFAIFPVLSLFAQNSQQLPVLEWLRPALVVIGLTLSGWFGMNLRYRDPPKSAILVTIFLVLFFSFGRVIGAVEYALYTLGLVHPSLFLFQHTFAMVSWGLVSLGLLLFGSFLVVKSHININVVSEGLNVCGTALVLLAALNLAYVRLSTGPAIAYADQWNERVHSTPVVTAHTELGNSKPDVYYIILDGYGRGDILRSLYGHDNSDFNAFLARNGFYVAEQSHSNYVQTPLSLASSLNSTYLDSLAADVGLNSGNRLPLATMIESNQLFKELHDRGYTVVTFSTGFDLTDIKTGDEYIAPEGDIDPFENAFLDTTPLPLLLRLPFFKSQYDLHRERILFSLNQVGELRIDGPKVIFLHVVAPHPPFVFAQNGEPLDPDVPYDLSDGNMYTARASQAEYVTAYRNQLIFINSQVQVMIAHILANSKTPPIIIIQGDHGPGSRLDWTSAQNTDIPERLSILNAYFFPDHNYAALYPTITPVNSFRVVLNQFFGTKYQMLPDRSYFSTLAFPYQFTDVTNRLEPPGQP